MFACFFTAVEFCSFVQLLLGNAWVELKGGVRLKSFGKSDQSDKGHPVVSVQSSTCVAFIFQFPIYLGPGV